MFSNPSKLIQRAAKEQGTPCWLVNGLAASRQCRLAAESQTSPRSWEIRIITRVSRATETVPVKKHGTTTTAGSKLMALRHTAHLPNTAHNQPGLLLVQCPACERVPHGRNVK